MNIIAYLISNQANGYLESSAIVVTASTQYELFAWVRGELDGSDSEGNWSVSIRYYTSSDVFISEANTASGSSLTTTWTKSGGTITTPSNAVRVRIRLYNKYNTGWAAFDDVVLKLLPASSPNLVTNPGFESSGNWTEVRDAGFPGTSFSRCSQVGACIPHNDSYTYVIGNLASGMLQSDQITVSANKEYDLNTWVSGLLDDSDSAGSWQLKAVFYNSSQVEIGSQSMNSGTPDLTSLTWQQIGGRILTPANTASVRIQLRLTQVSGWVDFDDVSLQEVLTYNLIYDSENRMVKVLKGTTPIAAYIYDGDGVRVRQVLTDTGVTATVFVKNYYEQSGTTITKYYYAGSQRVAVRTGSDVRYLFGDHLGSTSVSADLSGGSITRQLYKAWGETRYSEGLPTKYQYTGQYSNTSDFGLIFYNARWWDPALGRFAQADSIIPGAGNPSVWDRFAGMLNNPVNLIDPSGHWPIWKPWTDSAIPYQSRWALTTNVTKVAELAGRSGIEAQYIPVKDSGIYKQKYLDNPHYNLCGHLAFASAYEGELSGRALGMIWDLYPTGIYEYSNGETWITKINSLDDWSAEYKSIDYRKPYEDIKSTLEGGASTIMVLCTLDTTTGLLVTLPSGDYDTKRYVSHWVSVAGISKQEILIYNPFTNSFQPYTWKEFGDTRKGAVVLYYHQTYLPPPPAFGSTISD